MPSSERPQERLEKLGAGALSDRDLIAMIIRSGTKEHDVLSLADFIIGEAKSLAGLLKWDASDFQRIKGIGKVKALQLSVQVEVAKRMLYDMRPTSNFRRTRKSLELSLSGCIY